MRKIYLLATLLLGSVACAAASAQTPGLYEGNVESVALQNAAAAFEAQNKFTEALERYSAAAKADPKTSVPLSKIAWLFWRASEMTSPDNVKSYRNKAEQAARAALTLAPANPTAQEVLRLLDDDDRTLRHKPLADARAAVLAGEALFKQKKFNEAAVQYQRAVALDPQYADALIYLGDCYFLQDLWPDAEKYFRQAIAIDPLSGQAWRFLADTLTRAGKPREAESAVFAAIAARPSELPSWMRLEQALRSSKITLTPLHLVRHANADEKTKVLSLDDSLPVDSLDMIAWIAYGMTRINLRGEQPALAPFEVELQAWSAAMKVIDEVSKGQPPVLRDEALSTLYKISQAGQLRPAVFLLLFREAYRPDFEAWKKTSPDGVRTFIDTFRVKP